MRVQYVHGIGGWDTIIPPGWQGYYQTTINGLLVFRGQPLPTYLFTSYDDLFVPYLAALDYATYVANLALLYIGRGIIPPGLLTITDQVKWTAGMVVTWLLSPQLRSELRQRLLSDIQTFRPDLLICHSMGSLIAYDLFVSTSGAVPPVWVVVGSQIALVWPNLPLVSLNYPAGIGQWFWCYNENDTAFAWVAPPGQFSGQQGFVRVETPFLCAGPTPLFQNHNDVPATGCGPGDSYLTHPNTLP